MKARLIKKFEDELMVLEKELKTELPQEIKRARELGDLRENAEYHAAKERQRLVESRISLLKKRVSDIHLMNLDKIPRDKVGFGSTVHLKDGATAAVTVYQLVMPEDADVEHGLDFHGLTDRPRAAEQGGRRRGHRDDAQRQPAVRAGEAADHP